MDAHGPGTVRASHVLVVLASFSDAYQRGDWTELRSFYHEDALLCTQAAYQRVVGPDEVVSIFADLEGTAYSLGQTTSVAIDESAALVSAQLRYPLEHGGMADGHRYWVITFKDDLVYRTCFYRSEAEARTAYDEHGLDLGIHERT